MNKQNILKVQFLEWKEMLPKEDIQEKDDSTNNSNNSNQKAYANSHKKLRKSYCREWVHIESNHKP